ncbi:hypothetical protein HDV01_000993 [Terramyces sp. JEL0728]|nr:hypothetical protein HDV01_000993 [Terramyces sp. JEL0728]
MNYKLFCDLFLEFDDYLANYGKKHGLDPSAFLKFYSDMKTFHSIRSNIMQNNPKGAVILLKDSAEIPLLCLKFFGLKVIDLLIITQSVLTNENMGWIEKLTNSVETVNQLDIIGMENTNLDDSRPFADNPPLTRLGTLSSVKKLSLKYSTSIQDNFVSNFSAAITFYNIQILSLEQVEINDYFGEALGPALSNSNLKALSLFLIRSEDDYLKPILLGVAKSKVKSLEILCCKSKVSPWPYFAELLKNSHSITTLRICSEFVSNGFDLFCSSLSNNLQLSELYIDSTNFRPYQYEVFAKSIPLNLKSLNFQSSTTPPIHSIVELASETRLRSLVFSNEDSIDVDLSSNLFLTQFGDGFLSPNQLQVLARNKKLHNDSHIKLFESSRAIPMLDLPYELKVEIFHYLCSHSFLPNNGKRLKRTLLQVGNIGKLDQSIPFDICNLDIQ